MIYEAKYHNGVRTIVHDFNEIAAFIRDMKIGAEVIVWQNGGPIMVFEIKASRD